MEQHEFDQEILPPIDSYSGGNVSNKLNRRQFLQQLSGATAASLATGGTGLSALSGQHPPAAFAAETTSSIVYDRRWQAYRIRHDAAFAHANSPLSEYPTNGDEDAYPNKIASFTKCLPHTERGEVELTAYAALIKALEIGQPAAFDAIPLGGRMKFANPLAAYAFELEGYDPHQVPLPAPPAFSSAGTADELIELYWQALTRDVPFAEYETHPLTIAAAEDLSKCSDFQGPKANGAVTPTTLFRGNTPGDWIGPYLSQFLWLDVPYGNMTLSQRGRVPIRGNDYITVYPEWLQLQRGLSPTRANVLDPTPRYLRNGRDLGEYVHKDFTYQAFLHACLILLAIGAPLKADQFYRQSRTQSGFITFGPPHVLDTVARVANAALKSAWSHKWLVHRRLRPEAFAGRVHNHLTGAVQYPIHPELLSAAALSAVFRASGSYLLPMAYPEGCPPHPAYPAGHAAIAGACVTVLKAFFNEAFVIPNPMVASADGLSLTPYNGSNLTVGGELNKLAANIALGRNAAGVHWRSDGIEGLKLGEAVTLGVLTDLRATCPEHFTGFILTKFDGTMITV